VRERRRDRDVATARPDGLLRLGDRRRRDVGVYWYGGAVGYEILAFIPCSSCAACHVPHLARQHTYV